MRHLNPLSLKSFSRHFSQQTHTHTRTHTYSCTKNMTKRGKKKRNVGSLSKRERERERERIPMLLHTGSDKSSLTGFPFSQHPSSSSLAPFIVITTLGMVPMLLRESKIPPCHVTWVMDWLTLAGQARAWGVGGGWGGGGFGRVICFAIE